MIASPSVLLECSVAVPTFYMQTILTYNRNCSSQKGFREVLTTLVIWLWGGLSINTTQAGSMVPGKKMIKIFLNSCLKDHKNGLHLRHDYDSISKSF